MHTTQAARSRAGRTRPPRDPVLRGSVDMFSKEAMRRRPFSNGTRSDAQLKIAALVKTAEEYQAESAHTGEKFSRGALGHNGPKVLAAFLEHLDYHRNVTDSALSQICSKTDIKDPKTIIKIRDALVDAKFLGTLRRSVATGALKAFGIPQRQQVSNLTWPTPDALPERWRSRYYEIYSTLKRERSEAHRNIREVEGMTRQQRAERRQARRREALAARSKMHSGGQERALSKLNPTAAARIREQMKTAKVRVESTGMLPNPLVSAEDEQAELDRVEANLPKIMEEYHRSLGRHASG